MRNRFKLAALSAAMAVSCAAPALADSVEYTFTTGHYDTTFNHYLTPVQYETSMRLEMALTLSAPLAANLDQVAIAPETWRFSDGQFDAEGSAPGRFNGYVSTDGAGRISTFLIQIFLDTAKGSPGVWIKRTGTGDSYATALGQFVTLGSNNPCPGYGVCDPVPQTVWAQDRATGNGAVTVKMESLFTAEPQLATFSSPIPLATLPLPSTLAALGLGLVGLGGLRRRRA